MVAGIPRYIADPMLGIHFGRARGPELNSASLGVYLTVCLWCAWILRPDVRRVWQLLLLGAVPLMIAGHLCDLHALNLDRPNGKRHGRRLLQLRRIGGCRCSRWRLSGACS